MPIKPKDIYVYREDGSIPAVNHRALKRHGNRSYKLDSSIGVARTGAAGGEAFQACIRIAGGSSGKGYDKQKKRASGFTSSCAFGKNPRDAIRKALATASRNMKSRSGAFE